LKTFEKPGGWGTGRPERELERSDGSLEPHMVKIPGNLSEADAR